MRKDQLDHRVLTPPSQDQPDLKGPRDRKDQRARIQQSQAHPARKDRRASRGRQVRMVQQVRRDHRVLTPPSQDLKDPQDRKVTWGRKDHRDRRGRSHPAPQPNSTSTMR